MNLADLIADLARAAPPQPWRGESKIPWHDAEFSRRMLEEHLSQAHDAASRRSEIIDRQVEWIDATLLARPARRILDLGCGPGLYTSRLAERGHRCTGVDYAPAAIEHARAQVQAGTRATAPEYVLGDIREVPLGAGYDLVMLIYGELNAFSQRDAAGLLQRARAALAPGGALLLEMHSFEFVRALGQRPAVWHAAEHGLFGDAPYLSLHEHWWIETAEACVERYFVIDTAAAVRTYVSTTQAYADECAGLLAANGFAEIQRTGVNEGLYFVVARPD